MKLLTKVLISESREMGGFSFENSNNGHDTTTDVNVVQVQGTYPVVTGTLYFVTIRWADKERMAEVIQALFQSALYTVHCTLTVLHTSFPLIREIETRKQSGENYASLIYTSSTI